jgi:hypothetical protein
MILDNQRSRSKDVLKQKRTIAAVSTLLLCLCGASGASAQIPAAQHEVLRAVKNSKVLPEGTDVRASLSGRSVVITVYQDAVTSDKNCKIDAAVITKSVTDSFPDVLVVRLLFYERKKPYVYRCVDVQKSLIDQFGKGKIADTVMIDALTVVTGKTSAPNRKETQSSGLDSYNPMPGMALEERSANLMYIRKLKRLGGNADSFFQRFMAIEKEHVGQGKFEGFASAMNSLNSDLVTAIAAAQSHNQAVGAGAAGYDLKRGELYDRRRAVYSLLEQLSRDGKNVDEMKRLFLNSVEAKVGRPESRSDMEQTLTYIENRIRYLR